MHAIAHTHTQTETHTKNEAQVARQKKEVLGQLVPWEDQTKTEIEADWKRLVNQFKEKGGGGHALGGGPELKHHTNGCLLPTWHGMRSRRPPGQKKSWRGQVTHRMNPCLLATLHGRSRRRILYVLAMSCGPRTRRLVLLGKRQQKRRRSR